MQAWLRPGARVWAPAHLRAVCTAYCCVQPIARRDGLRSIIGRGASLDLSGTRSTHEKPGMATVALVTVLSWGVDLTGGWGARWTSRLPSSIPQISYSAARSPTTKATKKTTKTVAVRETHPSSAMMPWPGRALYIRPPFACSFGREDGGSEFTEDG